MMLVCMDINVSHCVVPVTVTPVYIVDEEGELQINCLLCYHVCVVIWWSIWKLTGLMSDNRHIPQISQCIRQKSHNAPFCYRTVHILQNMCCYITFPLHWRHNGHDSVSNHQLHDCLLNRLFRHRSKKISKLRVTDLCVGNSPETGEFPAQMASNAENVSIQWRHHENHKNTNWIRQTLAVV